MSRWSPFVGIALLAAVSTGCSSFDLANGDDTGNAGDDTADSTDSADTQLTDDSAAEAPAPSWIRIDGSFTVVEGEVDPSGTALAIEYRIDPAAVPAEPVDTADSGLDAGVTLPCTRTPSVTAITPETAPDPAITLAWWAITLDQTPDPECTHALPQGLHLGLGTLDPQLYAAMDLAGLSVDQSDLYGLYVRTGAETDPVWIYGVGGTAGQYDGTVTPVSAPPLPDGVYTLQALHLLPYSGS